jgi:hypothetical protein
LPSEPTTVQQTAPPQLETRDQLCQASKVSSPMVNSPGYTRGWFRRFVGCHRWRVHRSVHHRREPGERAMTDHERIRGRAPDRHRGRRPAHGRNPAHRSR